MSQQLNARRLEYKQKTKITLKNLTKLKEISQQLENKEREFENNKETIQKWTVFQGKNNNLIAQHAALLQEVILFSFVFCLFTFTMCKACGRAFFIRFFFNAERRFF